jgi:hypothetical protein
MWENGGMSLGSDPSGTLTKGAYHDKPDLPRYG